MPRWKALPDELDPQVKEFASQLRLLVDRNGLSIAAVADRTGYSKTSWERYLNGRLLAPKGAVVALAEVTGTSPVHLATMWELAERAWSRSEMRHDMTMEAIRISQARAALGEFGPSSAKGSGGRQQSVRRGGRATAAPGIAGPAGGSPAAPPSGPPSRSPSVPAQPSGRDGGQTSSGGAAGGTGGAPGPSAGGAGRAGGSWGAVASTSDGAGRFGPVASTAPVGPPRAAGGPEPQDARPAGAGSGEDSVRRKRRPAMFLAAVVGALVVVAVAVHLTRGGEKKDAGGTPRTPAASVSARPDLPPGVKCGGAACTGKDPEKTGCGGRLARTTTSVTVGTTLVEVRYSETCGTAWARVTRAAVGDRVEVSTGAAEKRTAAVDRAADRYTYTPMVAVKDAGDAKACATLTSGQKGCTT
ncbi:XRE family transcriptional regulator [Streptomyces sp. NBC_01007]|nr:XRE family transcriptional regulator [Streptomyces sp. NBC_01007]